MFFVKTFKSDERVLCTVCEKSFRLIIEPIFRDSLTIDLTGRSLDGNLYFFDVGKYEHLAIGDAFVSELHHHSLERLPWETYGLVLDGAILAPTKSLDVSDVLVHETSPEVVLTATLACQVLTVYGLIFQF